MRKNLLSLALLAMALPGLGAGRDRATRQSEARPLPGLTLQAPTRAEADQPITDPEGEISLYFSQVYWIHEGNTYYDEGILARLCRAADGSTVYINSLMPAWQEGWLKGSVQNGDLHFPSAQLVSCWGIGDIYMGAAVQNPRSGAMELIDEFVLTATDEGYRLEDYEGKPVFIMAYLEDGTLLEADYDLRLILFTDTEAVPPADAQEAKYTRTYFDEVSKFPYSGEVTVASVGDDLWLEGFNGHEGGFVKGHLEADGSIFIPSGQYVGQSGAYAFYMFTAIDDPAGGLTLTEGLTLKSDGEGWRSGQADQIRFGYAVDQIDYAHKNFTLKPSTESLSGVEVEAVESVTYDLSGRRIETPSAGLYIRVTTLADGTRRAEKITF